MRKLFSIFAALLVALAVNAAIDPGSGTLKAAISAASSGDVIELKAGTYDEGSIDIYKNLTIKAADMKNKPVVKAVALGISGDAAGVRVQFEGIKFDAQSVGEHLLFSYDETNSGNKLILEGCEFYDYTLTNSLINCGSGYKLDSLVVNNCYFHNIKKSCIFLENAGLVGLKVTNSTFANISTANSYTAGPIQAKGSTARIEVNNCTFYECNCMNSDYGAVGYRTDPSTNVLISNCIFALAADNSNFRAIYVKGGFVKNCLTHHYTKSDSHPGIHSGPTISDCLDNVDPKFTDAANNDFTLAETSPAHEAGVAGTHLGDPRWWPASWQPAEVIEVTSVALDAAELAIDVNETAFLHATVLPNDASDPSVLWTSSNNAIATVANGAVKGIAAGTVTITAKAGEKTATCEVTVSDAIPSTDFAEPYFLKGTKAALEGNIIVSEADSLTYPDTKLKGTAIWTINALNGGEIQATVNYKTGSSSGSKFALVILDELGNKVGDTIAMTSRHDHDGDYIIPGTIVLPKAGVYTIKLDNRTEWSGAKLRGITLTDVTPQRLYLKPGIWYWEGNQEKFAIYSWADGVGDAWSDYMTLAEDETDIWTGTIPYNHDHVIFVRYSKDSQTPSWSDNMWNKTFDLALEEGKDMYSITAWGDKEGAPCPGEWSKYTHVVNPKFYIAGSMTEWGDNKIPVYGESHTLSLEAGTYQLKVVDGDDWLGYDALTEKTAYLFNDSHGNVNIKLAAAGNVTVTYVAGTTFTVEGDLALPTIALAGAMNGWSTTANVLIPADNKETASVNIELNDNYYEFKIVEEGSLWLGKDTGDDSNYVINRSVTTVDGLVDGKKNIVIKPDVVPGYYKFTWEYATGKLTVTFPWPTAIDNSDADIKVEKFFRDGQIIIRKNGVEYNAQGAIVK